MLRRTGYPGLSTPSLSPPTLCATWTGICSSTQTVRVEHLLRYTAAIILGTGIQHWTRQRASSHLLAGGERTEKRQTCQVMVSFRKKNKAETSYEVMVRMAPLMWCLTGKKPQYKGIWGKRVSGRRNCSCKNPEVRLYEQQPRGQCGWSGVNHGKWKGTGSEW